MSHYLENVELNDVKKIKFNVCFYCANLDVDNPRIGHESSRWSSAGS